MTEPFDSYKLYNALRLHFETDYDAVKYNYKSNVSPQSFFKRKDKYLFAKVAKNYGNDLLGYYVSNFKEGVSYVGDMGSLFPVFFPRIKFNDDASSSIFDFNESDSSLLRFVYGIPLSSITITAASI